MYRKLGSITHIFFFTILLLSNACQDTPQRTKPITSVHVEPMYVNETLSIRALDFNETAMFYGSFNHFGKRSLNSVSQNETDSLGVVNENNQFKYVLNHQDEPLHFRAIEVVNGDVFALSIGNPARLYRLPNNSNAPELVYEEIHDKVFYDALAFWNPREGIAIGDPTDGCISIIITRDGGSTWNKLSCDDLPKAKDGEAAFAASDSNIAIIDDHTWVATGGKASRILYSADKGQSWEVIDTPIIQGKETTGIYALDFYDADNGFAIGGDYTQPDDAVNNKIRTDDGGKTWQVVSNGSVGYRSCVQYIPNSNALELVAVGFKGIDYSNDAGETWTHLSDEGFYTIRFLNDSVAYAAGKGRISKLTFK